jgi:predicted transcriptional regulator
MWVSPLVVDRTGFRKELQAGLARRGISQTRLAVILDVTPSYVSMVISGRRLPSDSRRWLAAVGVQEVPMVFPKGGAI